MGVLVVVVSGRLVYEGGEVESSGGGLQRGGNGAGINEGPVMRTERT